jgi:hypothetical protein
MQFMVDPPEDRTRTRARIETCQVEFDQWNKEEKRLATKTAQAPQPGRPQAQIISSVGR